MASNRVALASQKAPFAAGSSNGVAVAKPMAQQVQTSFPASTTSPIELCGETPESLRNYQKSLDSKSLETRFRKSARCAHHASQCCICVSDSDSRSVHPYTNRNIGRIAEQRPCKHWPCKGHKRSPSKCYRDCGTYS